MKTDDRGWCLNKQGDYVHPDLIKVDDKLKDEMVDKIVKQAIELSETIAKFKADGFVNVEGYFEQIQKEYGIEKPKTKGNLTLENFAGDKKIQIAVANNIKFDEKLKVAKVLLDEYLDEVTKDSNADVKTLITKAFEVDKEGDVNPRMILSLRSYNITHPKWKKAMDVISESIKIDSKKSYIRFYNKNEDGKYKLVPLDIAVV
jgi:hypothetical protein